MKPHPLLIVAFTLLPSLCGCQKPSKELRVMNSTAHWVDVTAGENRYYGIAMEIEVVETGGRHWPEFSSVVLSPWDDRSDTTVSVGGGTSRFKLKNGPVDVSGRHACVVDPGGTRITVFPADIPVSAYITRESLAAKIRQIIEEADATGGTRQPVPSN